MAACVGFGGPNRVFRDIEANHGAGHAAKTVLLIAGAGVSRHGKQQYRRSQCAFQHYDHSRWNPSDNARGNPRFPAMLSRTGGRFRDERHANARLGPRIQALPGATSAFKKSRETPAFLAKTFGGKSRRENDGMRRLASDRVSNAPTDTSRGSMRGKH